MTRPATSRGGIGSPCRIAAPILPLGVALSGDGRDDGRHPNDETDEPGCDREPTDDQWYNRPGVEGGIGYAPDDQPGSLGENDWRL